MTTFFIVCLCIAISVFLYFKYGKIDVFKSANIFKKEMGLINFEIINESANFCFIDLKQGFVADAKNRQIVLSKLEQLRLEGYELIDLESLQYPLFKKIKKF